MGSRGTPLEFDAPVLLVDHHCPIRGVPKDAIVVSPFVPAPGADPRLDIEEPIANTSWITFAICEGVTDCTDLAWLAALGAVGDLGTEAPLPGLRDLVRSLGITAVRDAVALLNAPRRHGNHDIAAAYAVLQRGRVNFVVRSKRPIDLQAWLHGLGVPLPGDAGYGHARATGGSLRPEQFSRLLAAAGFEPEPPTTHRKA